MRNFNVRPLLTAASLALILTAGTTAAAPRESQVRQRETAPIERAASFAKKLFGKVIRTMEIPTVPHPAPDPGTKK